MDGVLFLHYGLDGDTYRLHVWHSGFRDGCHLFSGRHFGARLLFLGTRSPQRKSPLVIVNNPMLTIETIEMAEDAFLSRARHTKLKTIFNSLTGNGRYGGEQFNR